MLIYRKIVFCLIIFDLVSISKIYIVNSDLVKCVLVF